MPLIGHIQIAGVPTRAEPDEGEVAYDRLLRRSKRWAIGLRRRGEYRRAATSRRGSGGSKTIARRGGEAPPRIGGPAPELNRGLLGVAPPSGSRSPTGPWRTLAVTRP